MADPRQRLLGRLRSEVEDGRVIDAMERVSREAFVRPEDTDLAYDDAPLPIGSGQTISQPLIVAIMVSALAIRRTDSVLEVGTGSGYQAAILSRLARVVVTVERIGPLADSARERLARLGYPDVHVKVANEKLGWPPCAPYDAIIVAAAAPKLPRELIAQLAPGGRMIVPVGTMESQELMKVTMTGERYSVQTLGGCRFVPLVGAGAWPETTVPGL